MTKKILAVLVAILLISGVAYASNDNLFTPGYRTSPGIGDKLGQVGFASSPHKIFRLVRISKSGADVIAVSADSIMVLDTTSDDGVTVVTTMTSGDSRVVGILVTKVHSAEVGGLSAHNDIGNRNWGWLQTYGLSQVSVDALGGFSVGDGIGCSTDEGQATGVARIALLSSAETAQTSGAVAGFAVDDGAASGTNIEVFLRLD